MAIQGLYRPAAILRLLIRLEDYATDSSTVPTEEVPFDARVKELAATEARLSQALARARAGGNQATAQAAIANLARVRVQLDGLRAQEPRARAIENELGDVFSVNFLAVPIEVSVELNSWRIADTCSAVLAYRDAPLISQLIRSALVEVYLGTVPVEHFATPERWRLTLDRANLVFRGYVDEWRNDHSGDDATVTIEARSLEAILIDTKVHPASPLYRPRGREEGITSYVNRVLDAIPATSGNLRSLVYRSPVEPTLSRALFVRQLQTAQSQTTALGPVSDDVSTDTDPGQVEGVGQPRLTTDQVGSETSAWDLITKACGLCGLVPSYDPSVVAPPGVFFAGGQLRSGEVPGDFLLLRPPQTLFDDVDGGYQIEGGPQDGFSRQIPDPNSAVKALKPSQVRFLVWGRNIKELSTSRNLGRVKAPTIEVISYNPDAEPKKRTLRARFPKTRRSTRVGAQGNGKVEEVITRYVKGVRDQAQLEQIAVGIHHAIARNELSVTIETDDLASYIDPTLPDGSNENPDILKLRHGTPVRVVVARQVDDPRVGNSLVVTPLSDVFERRTDELRRFLLEQNQRFRPDLDPDLSEALVGEMVTRLAAAMGSSQAVDLFYTRAVRHTWRADEGWSGRIELVNYVEARNLPQNLGPDDRKADAVRRIPATGVKEPAAVVARRRARRSQGVK